MTYTLKDVLLPNDSKVNIVIDGELIAAIGQESSGEVIDCNGLRVMPGFVDLHTHLREPGKEDSETVLTGSRAAVLGGFTAVSAMANTFPVADTAGVVEQVFRLGKEAGLCDVYPVGAVTQGLQGERLAELGAMADSAAQVRIFRCCRRACNRFSPATGAAEVRPSSLRRCSPAGARRVRRRDWCVGSPSRPRRRAWRSARTSARFPRSRSRWWTLLWRRRATGLRSTTRFEKVHR